MAGLGLLDIEPPKRVIKIGAKSLQVGGISARNIAQLLARFPDIERAIGMQVVDADAAVERAALFRKAGPEAIAAIIAAATGNLGDEGAEAIADALPLEAQMDILEATFALTFPSGVGPFVKRLQSLTGTSPPPAVVPPVRGKAPATTSPPPPKNSSREAASPTLAS